MYKTLLAVTATSAALAGAHSPEVASAASQGLYEKIYLANPGGLTPSPETGPAVAFTDCAKIALSSWDQVNDEGSSSIAYGVEYTETRAKAGRVRLASLGVVSYGNLASVQDASGSVPGYCYGARTTRDKVTISSKGHSSKVVYDRSTEGNGAMYLEFATGNILGSMCKGVSVVKVESQQTVKYWETPASEINDLGGLSVKRTSKTSDTIDCSPSKKSVTLP